MSDILNPGELALLDTIESDLEGTLRGEHDILIRDVIQLVSMVRRLHAALTAAQSEIERGKPRLLALEGALRDFCAFAGTGYIQGDAGLVVNRAALYDLAENADAVLSLPLPTPSEEKNT